MSDFDYYKAPSDEIFDEIKRASMVVWNTYDDTYGYATEKINRIKDLKNIQDNAWYMVAMFDISNQLKLLLNLNKSAMKAVGEMLTWSHNQEQEFLLGNLTKTPDDE